MSKTITIEQVKKSSPDICNAIRSLTTQLDEDYKPLSDDDIKGMINSEGCFIFAARSQNKIVGMITLIIYRIPYTKKAVLEDVVVDEDFRGQGIGTKLIQTAIAKAKKTGAFIIDFTSRPNRESANRLYKKLGFKQRETNVYRLEFD